MSLAPLTSPLTSGVDRSGELAERLHREFARPAGLSVWSEGSPQGRDSGVRFFGYFLVASQESTSPAGARPGRVIAEGISSVGADETKAKAETTSDKVVAQKTSSACLGLRFAGWQLRTVACDNTPSGLTSSASPTVPANALADHP